MFVDPGWRDGRCLSCMNECLAFYNTIDINKSARHLIDLKVFYFHFHFHFLLDSNFKKKKESFFWAVAGCTDVLCTYWVAVCSFPGTFRVLLLAPHSHFNSSLMKDAQLFLPQEKKKERDKPLPCVMADFAHKRTFFLSLIFSLLNNNHGHPVSPIFKCF